ncbi:PDR/VanB family oxidoreductase [Nocardia sp. NPDC003345]
MSHPGESTGQTFRMEVESIHLVADDVVELVLVNPGRAPLPGWEPGAHLDLHLPGGMIRQYSLVPAPSDRAQYRVAVLREPRGRGGSEYIHTDLRPGTILRCAGPRNNFSFRPAPAYRFVAGGIGITPLLQMIECAEATRTAWNLMYFGRTASAMAWADELLTRYPDRVVRHPDDVHGPPDLSRALAGLRDGELIYACGPGGMLEAITQELGDDAARILQVERFTPANPATLIRDRQAFDVYLDRSGIELHVPADKSILEVMEELGLPVISSCREGTCGTCETAILSGSADHRDSILTDEEKAADESMMICCSRGRGTRLVLDA